MDAGITHNDFIMHRIQMKTIQLKSGKEKALLRRHPWVFSGAIQKRDNGIEGGEIVSVCDSRGRHLGFGYCNPVTPISVRMLSFGEEEITRDYLRGLVRNAVTSRVNNPLLRDTDSYRIIFSEGDMFPGLIVDSYGNHLVMQCLTLGIDRMKTSIIEILIDELQPKSIYERSDHEGRRLEGLDSSQGQVYGTTPEEVVIHENGLSYYVQIHRGHKTGFYLDQRDNRSLIARLASGRDLLNLFCYTGAFSVSAASGGARAIVSVDSSGEALETAKNNMELNRFAIPGEFIRSDVFRYLRDKPIRSNLIILDPPALAKDRGSVENACRGYKDLHLQIASKCPPGTLLLTCSCSRFIDMSLFQMVIFSAFADAGRAATIIGKYHQPCDHPTSLYCRETEYLKGILLTIH